MSDNMTENNYIVYYHENKINKKRYVGMTKNSMRVRWDYGQGYKHNHDFNNDIKEFGQDNFDHVILAENLDRYTAEELEKYYISLYHTTDKRFGYNLSTGGLAPTTGIKHTEETKRKMSIAKKNRPVSQETREKLSKIMKSRPAEMREKFAHNRRGKSSWCAGVKGENNPLYGRPLSEERKDHIAEARMKHQIRHIPTGKVFKTYREIEKTTGVSKLHVYKHCKNYVKTPEWEFV